MAGPRGGARVVTRGPSGDGVNKGGMTPCIPLIPLDLLPCARSTHISSFDYPNVTEVPCNLGLSTSWAKCSIGFRPQVVPSARETGIQVLITKALAKSACSIEAHKMVGGVECVHQLIY